MPPTPLPLGGPWRCHSCRNVARPFSSATIQRQVRPESPRYIDIPEPPQKDRVRRTRVRGTLPVPRDIFRRQDGGVDRVTPEYLASATQVSSKEPNADPAAPSAAYREWKQRMAVRRRQNFREGLRELEARRRRSDNIVAARILAKERERKEAIDAPQREDERLTSPTTTALMRTTLQTRGGLPDPNREERVAAMRARVQEKEALRSEQRQDALHSLYMHARSFITSERELDAVIEKQFGTIDNPAKFGYRGTSIWSSKLPESIGEKLRTARGARELNEDEDIHTKLLGKRLRKVAEELSGGKM